MSDSLLPHGLYSPQNSPGQNTEVGCLFLLQGIFPTQGSNPGLPHCERILYCLSPKRSPRILERVAYPFSRGLPDQESNQGLLHCRWVLYQLSYERSHQNNKHLNKNHFQFLGQKSYSQETLLLSPCFCSQVK